MKHFNKSVPANIKNKLFEIVNLLDINDITNNRESLDASTIEEIIGYSYDGFWAWQQGGYSFDTSFLFNCDSSYHFSDKQTEFFNQLQKYCEDDFKREFKVDAINYDDEEFQAYEDEYLDDLSCLLRVRMYCKDDKVFFDVSINYKDEYHREKHNEYLIEFEYTFKELLKTDNQEIISRLSIK